MSAVAVTPEPVDVLLTRSFEVPLEEGDGRTVVARIVPYNEVAMVADPPQFTPYREAFLPGSVTNAENRVDAFVNVNHEQGFDKVIGFARSELLEDRQDGCWATLRVLPGAVGDKALELVREGVLGALSLEFKSLRQRRVDGVVERIRVHVNAVSLVRRGAYPSAQVMAVREDVVLADPDTLPVLDPQVAERLAGYGVKMSGV